MTDTQRKIIEIAGDKTLSVGCIVDIIEYDIGESYKLGIHTIIEVYKYGDLIIHEERSGEYRECSDDINMLSDEDGTITGLYIKKIIGHPIHVGHLMRLSFEKPKNDLLENIIIRFNNNLHLYSQDCLSWDEETNQLILDYLLTVKGN